jgi:hypothetical protein
VDQGYHCKPAAVVASHSRWSTASRSAGDAIRHLVVILLDALLQVRGVQRVPVTQQGTWHQLQDYRAAQMTSAAAPAGSQLAARSTGACKADAVHNQPACTAFDCTGMLTHCLSTSLLQALTLRRARRRRSSTASRRGTAPAARCWAPAGLPQTRACPRRSGPWWR